MKEAKKVQITEQVCKQISLMRKGGANQTEIGALLGINPSTVSRIEKAGFDVGKYLENKRLAREKEKAAKETVKVELFSGPEKIGEEQVQVPGQISMDLTPGKPEEQDRIVKLMRFQAHEIDLILKRMSECFDMLIMKTDKLNDTMSMVLRALRKE